MPEVHRMRFHKNGTIRSWKKSTYGRNWEATTKPQFGTGGGYWNIQTDKNIIFEATHWSSIIVGLRSIGLAGIIQFPDGFTTIEHQYWITKKAQNRSLIGSMHQSGLSGLHEKRKHVHKVVIKPRGAPMSGSGTTLIIKSAASDMPASHLANALQAKENLIGKGPNAAGDALDVVMDGVSTIGDLFAT